MPLHLLLTCYQINNEQIKLAKRQGAAFQEAIKNRTQKEAQGTQRAAGDFIIAWASEKAEGMYVLRNGQLQWDGPQIENTQLEVAVCSLADGHFVPNLTPDASTLWAVLIVAMSISNCR